MSLTEISTMMNMINLNDSILKERTSDSLPNFNMRKEGRKLVGNSSMLDEDSKSRSETLPANWSSALMRQNTVHTAAVTSSSMNGHRRIDRSVSLPMNGAYLTEKDDRLFLPTDVSDLNQTQAKGGVTGTASGRYKTELCRPFEENGFCKYGDKCQFAHGRNELRILLRHPKYKTELCRTYHTTGICPYGPRCHFVHNSEECNLSVINQQLLQHQQLQQQQLEREQQVQQLRELILARQKLDEMMHQLSPNATSPTSCLQNLLSSAFSTESSASRHTTDDRRSQHPSFKRSSIGSSSNSPTPSCSGSDSRSASPDSLSGEIRDDIGHGLVSPAGLMTSQFSYDPYPLVSPDAQSYCSKSTTPFPAAVSKSVSSSSVNETLLQDLLAKLVITQNNNMTSSSAPVSNDVLLEVLRKLNTKVQ